jgi:hypothetical protein
LAQIEGNGSYTLDKHGSKGASGRYQIQQAAALDSMAKIGMGSNTSERIAIWQKCRASDTAECKKVQDDVCAGYVQIVGGKTVNELYLRWNMGAGGANAIFKAYKNGEKITDPALIARMDNQAWSRPGRKYHSNGDPKVFMDGLNWWINEKGIDPNAPT